MCDTRSDVLPFFCISISIDPGSNHTKQLQVSKNKAILPPPPRLPYHMEMWAGNAMTVLQVGVGVGEWVDGWVGTRVGMNLVEKK